MLAGERRESIVDVVRTQGPATVAELVERLGHSQATIRRDLLRLDSEGLLRRVHGGARPLEHTDEAFADVVEQNPEAKEAIALAALAEIADGQSVLLDIGTTVSRVAKHLHGRAITVITRNMAVYAELGEDDAVDLVLLGGLVRRHHEALGGYLTEECLRQVRADVALMGTSGVSRTGRSIDTDTAEVSVKRAMMAAADRVVLLADSTKFPGRGAATVCDATALAAVITEGHPDERTAAALRAGGAELVIAPPLP